MTKQCDHLFFLREAGDGKLVNLNSRTRRNGHGDTKSFQPNDEIFRPAATDLFESFLGPTCCLNP
jgi:hypothetical protein